MQTFEPLRNYIDEQMTILLEKVKQLNKSNQHLVDENHRIAGNNTKLIEEAKVREKYIEKREGEISSDIKAAEASIRKQRQKEVENLQLENARQGFGSSFLIKIQVGF
jgi:regulator of replication initiation timing